MKQVILCSLLFLSSCLWAETLYPAPFASVMYALHEGSFYDQQAREWEAFALGACSEEEAWFHYYKSAEYSNRFGSGGYDLSAILAQAEQRLDPAGFVYNYLHFAHHQQPALRTPFLLRAHAAAPGNPEAYTGLATHYEANGVVDERNAILLSKHRAQPIPAGVMEYNYNQLLSVGPNGILITHGDADTYPSWILQAGYQVRQDVRVVAMPLLLGLPEMRAAFFAELSLADPFSGQEMPPSVSDLMEHLTTQPRPIYFAATGQRYLAQLPKEKLYLTGLAFHYSTEPVENISLLAANYGQRWRMEQLRQPLSEGPGQAVADQLNQNYLPALLELRGYYAAGHKPQLAGVDELLQGLAKRAGVEESVAAYLKKEDLSLLASNTPGLRAKDIYKGTAFIPGGTYVPEKDSSSEKTAVVIKDFFLQTAEVSNADYQLFLEDLLRQRKFDLLDFVAVAPVDIAALNGDLPENTDPAVLAAHLAGSHPAFANYPVVNISYRAAELYAIWLAQVYNQDPKRADGKNVRFRLPEEAEFAYAAQGGLQNGRYPWGGPAYRNAKGCLLANFNTFCPESQEAFQQWKGNIQQSSKLSPKEKAELLEAKNTAEACDWEDDGGYLTVAVNTYFPNRYGLYNVAGNAAEMLAEKGKTAGGSWLDPPRFMQIGVVKERTLPHPSTGFRLVMEYID